jgi:hypothetical protein
VHYLLLFILFILMLAAGAIFRDKTGVKMPSRSAMRGIRRRAKKKGISVTQAFQANIRRKQKRML